jgi:hypothetical protein
MDKSFLKITTILCSLTALPGALIAETKIGTKGTATITKESGSSWVNVYSEKTDARGGTANREVQYSDEYGNDSSMYDTTANGRTIYTQNSSVDGNKSENIYITGSNGVSVGESGNNENGQISVSKEVYAR